MTGRDVLALIGIASAVVCSLSATDVLPSDFRLPRCHGADEGGPYRPSAPNMAQESEPVLTDEEFLDIDADWMALLGEDLSWVWESDPHTEPSVEYQQTGRIESNPNQLIPTEGTTSQVAGIYIDDGAGMVSGNATESVPVGVDTNVEETPPPTATMFQDLTRFSSLWSVPYDELEFTSSEPKGSNAWPDNIRNFFAKIKNTDHDKMEEIRDFFNTQEALADPVWLKLAIRRSFSAMIRCYVNHCRKDVSVFRERFPTLPLKSFHKNGCGGIGTECRYLVVREKGKDRRKKYQLAMNRDPIKYAIQLNKRRNRCKAYRLKKKKEKST